MSKSRHSKLRNRRRIFFLVGFPICAAVLAVGAYAAYNYQRERNTEKLLKQAQGASEAEDWARASKAYRQYLNRRPKDMSALRARAGVLLEQLKESPEVVGTAIATLRRLVKEDPGNTDAIGQLAELYVQLREFDDAKDLSTQWLASVPQSEKATRTLAAANRGLGEFEVATAGLVSAIETDPTSVTLYPPLIALYTLDLKLLDQAKNVLEQALEFGSHSTEIQLAAFGFHEAIQEFDTAENFLKAAVRMEPDDRRVLLTAAAYYVSQRRFESARPFLDRAAELFQHDPKLLTLLADSAVGSHDDKECIDVATILRENASDRYPHWAARAAELFITAGHFDEADECIEFLAGISLVDEKLESWLLALRGSRALMSGQALVAIPYFEAVLRREPTSVPTLEHLAAAYVQSDALEPAIDAYRKLIALAPESKNPRLALARLEAAKGNCDSALATLNPLPRIELESSREAALISIICDFREHVFSREEESSQKLLKRIRSFGQEKLASILEAKLFVQCLELVNFSPELEDTISTRSTDEGAGLIVGAAYGKHLVQAGRFDDALDVATELARRFPDAAGGHELALRVFAAKNHVAEAFTYINQLATEDHTKGILLQLLGTLLHSADPENALSAYRQCIALHPDSVVARIGIADLVTTLDEALTQIDAVRQLEGQAGVTWKYHKSACLLRLGKGSNDTVNEAIALLKNCLVDRPNWLAARILLANAYQSGNQVLEAVESYQTALSQHPELATSPVGLRLILLLKQLGRLVEADVILTQMANKAPESIQVLRLQTDRHYRRRNLSAAARTAEKVLNSQSDDAEWAALTAEIHLKNSNPSRAEEIARASLAKYADSTVLLWALASSLSNQGKNAEADEAMQKGAQDFPDVDHYWLLAQYFEQSNRHNKADNAITQAIDLEPDNVALLIGCAEIARRRGQRSRQIDLVTRAVIAKGDAPTGSLILARVLADGGSESQRAQASEIVSQRLRDNENDVPALVLHAQLLGSALPPDFQGAETALHKALSLNTRSVKAHQLLAAVQVRLGQLSRAAESATEGLSAAPNNLELLLLTAEIAGYRGEYERSITPLRQILNLRPRHQAAVRMLSLAYQELGQIDRAIRLVEQQSPEDQRSKTEIRALARLHEKKREFDIARVFYEQYAQVSNNSPAAFQALLHYVARRKKFPEVHRLAIEHKNEDAGDVASLATAAQILGTQPDDPALAKIGLAWLDEIARNQPDHATDAIYRAALCHYQRGRISEAESRFLQALKLAPEALAPVNALAWLYSEDLDRPEDGLALIERFLAAGGRGNAEMLDTHGTILLRLGRIDEAAEKFKVCIEIAGQTQTLTAATFHLGLATRKANRIADSQALLSRSLNLNARLGGLKDEDLEIIAGLLSSDSGIVDRKDR